MFEPVRAFCQRRSIALSSSEISVATIAEVFGVTASTICRWRKEGIPKAFSNNPKFSTTCSDGAPVPSSTGYSTTPIPNEKAIQNSRVGRPRKLTDAQLAELEALLSMGATAHGWPNELWTTKRMAELIRRHFKITCRPNAAWAIVTKYLKWTAQRPVQRLKSADEDETNRWLEEDFPQIVKRADRRGAHLVFLDESGFMLAPVIRRTYAPRGRTPVCKIADPHGKISVIGAMTISPQRGHFGFHFDMLQNNANYCGATVVPFLERLYRQMRGPLTILWDAIPIHRADPVARFLHKHRTIVPEVIPRYAPDLNPVDKVWFYVKYDRIPNFAPRQLSDLRARIRHEFHRLQQRPATLKSLYNLTRLSCEFRNDHECSLTPSPGHERQVPSV